MKEAKSNSETTTKKQASREFSLLDPDQIEINPLFRSHSIEHRVEDFQLFNNIPVDFKIGLDFEGDDLEFSFTPHNPKLGYKVTPEDFNWESRHRKFHSQTGDNEEEDEDDKEEKPLLTLRISVTSRALDEAGIKERVADPEYKSFYPKKTQQKLERVRVQVTVNGIVYEAKPSADELEESGDLEFYRFYLAETGPFAVQPKDSQLYDYDLDSAPTLPIQLPLSTEVLKNVTVRLVSGESDKKLTLEQKQQIVRQLFPEPPPKPRPVISSVNAVNRLKKDPPSRSALVTNFGDVRVNRETGVLVQQILVDKGFDFEVVKYLAERSVLGTLMSNLMIRQSDGYFDSAINRFVSSLEKFNPDINPDYTGTALENSGIDRSIKDSEQKDDDRRRFSGHGATRFFQVSQYIQREQLSQVIGDTPVLVLGGGAAGLLAVRGLTLLGFSPERVFAFDKKGEYGGIWTQKNVYQASKNNPFQISFEDFTVEAAPGPGRTITEFLKQIESSRFSRVSVPGIIRANIVSVEPGDLEHTVTYELPNGSRGVVRTPIVVNALGTGKPLDPSREGYMKTNAKNGEAGVRWQQVISEEQAEKFRGKRLVFVGLGNSTAEMLVQLSDFNRRGFDIDYRVLTHHPMEALSLPGQEIVVNDKSYRVFRDIKAPNLVRLAGDLADIRSAYYESMFLGKIIPGVTEWNVAEKNMEVVQADGSRQNLSYDQLYTLIGYSHDADSLRKMGMQVTDEYTGSIAYDYDGEIQRIPGALGRERLYPGYFGLGALLKTKDNPNAVVIPGIMHRMYDLLFTAAIRAAEYRENNQVFSRLTRLRNS